jgi:pantoate--beta-alanine ligase
MTGGGGTVGQLNVIRTVDGVRAAIAGWRRAGETVALIPTMGYLHEGHLALVDHGRRLCQRTVASLFVNPIQFGPTEDLDRYPRDEAGDRNKLQAAGCDLLYAPTVAEMYPPGFATGISVTGVSGGLCGAARPQMFGGVATVVTKLLLQTLPDVAVFGEKDGLCGISIFRCGLRGRRRCARPTVWRCRPEIAI